MSFLSSSLIRVFPATRRTANLTYARQVTEANLVGMINKLIDKDGFVITKLYGNEIAIDFSFNIHGYNFTAELGDIIGAVGSSATNVYATITIDPGADPGEHPEFDELLGQDSDEDPNYQNQLVYQGVDFTTTAQTGTNKYCLHILYKSGDNWLVPEDSQIKFSLDSIDISLIDGGVI